MSPDIVNLFIDARPELRGSTYDVAIRLFNDPQARIVPSAPSEEEVSQLLPTLRARQKTAANGGKTIFGLRQVIEKLEDLPEKSRVWGYGIISSQAAGNVYFGTSDRRVPLGATLVER